MADRLTAEQAAAVRPFQSAWISANAGSGKTAVLTGRVARCLLAGVRPDRVLCITFTRAAAGEMKSRLFRMLGAWAMLPDPDLKEALHGLLAPDESLDVGPEALATARRLFARALEFPGGLNIQTIHSFGISLLRRFPREVGLSPGVQILDEHRARELRDQTFADTLREAHGDEGRLGAAYRTLSGLGHPNLLEDLQAAALTHRDSWRSFAKTVPDEERVAFYRSMLNDMDGEAEAAAAAAFEAIAAAMPMIGPLDSLASQHGSLKDRDKTLELSQAAAAFRAGDRDMTLRLLRRGLLTKEGETFKRSPFSAKFRKAVKEAPCLGAVHGLSAPLHKIEHARRIRTVAEASAAATCVAAAYLDRYEAAKRAESGLDFDDVIRLTVRLLRQSDAREWIRYRLDGGVDHILVDEAQDTSPQQWETLKRLSEEFFEEPRERRKRTLFAVGDEKQSIFSFQGAAPEEFEVSKAHFEERLARCGDALFDGRLLTSFRSSPKLLEFVDNVFCAQSYLDGPKAKDESSKRPDGTVRFWAEGLIGFDRPLEHASFHAGRPGRIEVWNLFDPNDPDLAPEDRGPQVQPMMLVARRVAERIASWIDRGARLPASDRRMRPGDILVLVQNRTAFQDELVRSLRLRGVPVAGADRILVSQHVAVQDLLALTAFVQLPPDDFNLAALLRSPLCGLSEDDLYRIARDRPGSLVESLEGIAASDDRFREAWAFLEDMRESARHCGPYEFLERALTVHAGRRKLLKRLGEDAIEPIDALLAEAIAFQSTERGSLESFLWRMRQSEVEVKTDNASGPDAVRVMTVHGAKGLEAPVVILPDTHRMPNFAARERYFEGRDHRERPVPFFVPRKGDDDPEIRALREERGYREREESYRLFYVALTRAEQMLVVCGTMDRRQRSSESTSPGANAKCWYFRAAEAARRIGELVVQDERRKELDMLFDGFLVHSGAESLYGENFHPPTEEGAAGQERPCWATSEPPEAPRPPQWLAVSALGDLPGVAGPARYEADDAERRLLLGTVTHLLLERLADLPAGQDRTALGRALAEQFGADIPEDERSAVLARVLRILDDPALGPLLRADGLSEAQVTLRPGIQSPGLSGRIDRLVFQDDRLLVLDFKGDPEPSAEESGVRTKYLAQLGAYRLAVRNIYPDRRVATAILWTSAEPPRMTELGSDLVDDAYAEAVRAHAAGNGGSASGQGSHFLSTTVSPDGR